MSTPEAPWNAVTPPPQPSNRKLWWIIGGAGVAGCGFIVIGVLATIVVPNVMARLGTAQRAKIAADLGAIDFALEQYKVRHGAYPTSLDDLTAEGEAFSATGLPRDPWRHDYVMLAAEDGRSRPRLLTYGRDQEVGGEGPDEDVEHGSR